MPRAPLHDCALYILIKWKWVSSYVIFYVFRLFEKDLHVGLVYGA